MNNIDYSRPHLNYTRAEMIWRIYSISWYFPTFMSPLVLKFLLNLIYWSRYFKYSFYEWHQKSLVKQAEKMGVPISQDTTFVGLEIFRDLAKNPFYLSKLTNAKLLREHLKAREKITVDRMCETGRVFAEGNWKKWKADIFSDEFLHFAILNQAISYNLTKSEIPEFDYTLYLSALNYSDLYTFGIQDVRKIHVRKDDFNMLIIMSNGNEIRNDDKYWDLAKLYAQSAIYYYTVMYAHNWVHFSYPDVVVSKTYSIILNKSVFFKLMEPYIRYVMMTNSNVLSGYSTACHLGSFPDYIRPDAPSLTTQPELAEGLAKRAITFCSGENIEIAKDILATELRLGFPHCGFKDSEVPYLKNLYHLYRITHTFVNSVYENITEEHKKVEHWKEDILKLFPYIDAKKVNTVDFIATFIWQSSFIHSLDHVMTNTIYCKRGRTPLCLRKPFDLQTDMKQEETYHPIDLLTGWGFGHSFMAYNRSKIIDDSVAALNYHFQNETLITAQQKFKEDRNNALTLSWTFYFDKEKEIKIRTDDLSTSISY